MPVKRRNHGRQKMNRGSTNNLQCNQCGAIAAKDKAVSRTSIHPVIEAASMDDLRAASIYEIPEVPTFMNMENHCVSCATHLKIVHPRKKELRVVRSLSRGPKTAAWNSE